MARIGITAFQDNPWEKVTIDAFAKALGEQHTVTVLRDYPGEDERFDILFVVGVRPLWRFKLDEARLRRGARVICETGEYSLDPRHSFADHYGYFIFNGENPAAPAFRIPRFVREDLLYPAKNDEVLCIFVDHFMDRKPFMDLVAEQIERCPGPREVFYQNHDGVVRNPDFERILRENDLVDSRRADRFRYLPFEEIAAYYRRAHVFMPTHVETVGVVPSEVAACGGLALMPPQALPPWSTRGLPHMIYGRDHPVDWAEVRRRTTPDHQAAYREEILQRYGFAAFADALLAFVSSVAS